MKELQQNNPLHGLKLEVMLQELIDHYGWETLDFALNMNCFRNKPTLAACIKFMRKTTWAKEKTENFYLYRFKHLPRPNDAEFEIPPRDRLIPLDQKPRAPVVITPGSEPQPQLGPKPKFKSEREKSKKPRGDKPFKGHPMRAPKPRRSESQKSETSDPWSNDPWANSPKD
ncbi:DNA-binding protein VF530 [Alginatibacterium sediminis]|uniref:DNA-binding protein VF530 n=1 Tax=Alginatibacterium sediminis TaxID=2164068 RepID=A0A420E9M6_9ALTE|nr:VF530 family DNA-binding protein [Alginatibacterium sediminis]RKF15952.1 DNA-binding protein VF530 [Alginatibacterium sediminis]